MTTTNHTEACNAVDLAIDNGQDFSLAANGSSYTFQAFGTAQSVDLSLEAITPKRATGGILGADEQTRC